MRYTRPPKEVEDVLKAYYGNKYDPTQFLYKQEEDLMSTVFELKYLFRNMHTQSTHFSTETTENALQEFCEYLPEELARLRYEGRAVWIIEDAEYKPEEK